MLQVTLEDVPVKSTQRAQRRHDCERLKAARSRHLLVAGRGAQSSRASDRVIGVHANTAAPCSCWMCGNPRKFFGERTVQERRFDQVDVASALNS